MTDDTTDQQLTPLQRRLIDAAADIIETQADSPEFLHSVLCQVGLPRAETDARSFQRSSGTAAIEIAAGQLYRRGKFVPAPMPYGAKPRLVLMHLCAEAVRTRSPEIQVGRSIREFLGPEPSVFMPAIVEGADGSARRLPHDARNAGGRKGNHGQHAADQPL
jgi:hypothetical protein